MIYFVSASDFVKIGVAADVGQRISELQVGNPYDLELLLQIHGDVRSERAIHARLRPFHVRGEWFRLLSLFAIERGERCPSTGSMWFVNFGFEVGRIAPVVVEASPQSYDWEDRTFRIRRLDGGAQSGHAVGTDFLFPVNFPFDVRRSA